MNLFIVGCRRTRPGESAVRAAPTDASSVRSGYSVSFGNPSAPPRPSRAGGWKFAPEVPTARGRAEVAGLSLGGAPPSPRATVRGEVGVSGPGMTAGETTRLPARGEAGLCAAVLRSATSCDSDGLENAGESEIAGLCTDPSLVRGEGRAVGGVEKTSGDDGEEPTTAPLPSTPVLGGAVGELQSISTQCM